MAARSSKVPPRGGLAPPASPAAPPPDAPVATDPAGGRAAAGGRVHEPVWLVRFVFVLFLIGFAAFLAREVRNFVGVLP